MVAVRYGELGGPAPAALPADAPPDGVQLFYVLGGSHTLAAYDWTGNRRGSVHFPTWVDLAHVRAAPDGSGFLLDPQSDLDYAGYFDRVGRPLLETNDPGFVSQAWAEDSAHICAVYQAANGFALVTRRPGEPDQVKGTRLVGPVSVSACSLRTDTAVLVGQADVVVARVSTGGVVREASLAEGAGVVASTDAAYVAIAPPGGPVSVFRSSDLKHPVIEIDAGVTPLAFSGDDALLVALGNAGSAVVGMTWRNGRNAWTYDTLGAPVAAAVGRPSGSEVAILFDKGGVLVRGNGKRVELP